MPTAALAERDFASFGMPESVVHNQVFDGFGDDGTARIDAFGDAGTGQGEEQVVQL